MLQRDIELVVLERDKKVRRRKAARARLNDKLRRGELPTFQEIVEARGLVVRERRDSIFSDAWMPLALLFLFLGLAGGRNAALLAISLILLAIYLVAGWWQRNALVGVTYLRSFDRTRVFPGEPVTMSIEVDNRKPLPLTWLRFDDRLPVAPLEEGVIAEVTGETQGSYNLQNVFSLSGNGHVQRTYTLRFPVRGYYRVGPVVYRSGDLFTLFTVQRERDYVQTLVVYPRIYPIEALGLPAREPFGDLRVRQSLFADPIKTQGIRDYHPRDRFRDVHWKASARRGRLQTKVYDPSTGMNLVVFLNVATMHRHWMGYDPAQLERAISVAASIASYGVEQKWGVGLYANCAVPKSDQPIRVPPGRSPDQLAHVLEALAATTEFATGSIEAAAAGKSAASLGRDAGARYRPHLARYRRRASAPEGSRPAGGPDFALCRAPSGASGHHQLPRPARDSGAAGRPDYGTRQPGALGSISGARAGAGAAVRRAGG